MEVPSGLRRLWGATPRRLRRTIVAVVGSSIVLLGTALVVLPGPFTLPLLVAGFAILGTEFAWAASALARTKQAMAKGADLARAGAGAARNAASRPLRKRR